ncbi:chorismate-binding protein [Pseudactinotalea sp. Z1732]|uniref:chorismate-binding protein n=1 Tax=Micrococcales TaxID=85006 RepID=UPI003C7ABF27
MNHGRAEFAGVVARRAVDYADLRTDARALAGGGWWAVVAEFDGPWHAWRFADVRRDAPPGHARSGEPARAREADDGDTADAGAWHGPAGSSWVSSMSQQNYVDAVVRVRRYIRDGAVYQANICRILAASMAARPDAGALAAMLAEGNPAPYAGYIDVPGGAGADGAVGLPPAWVVTASPELGLGVSAGMVTSGPIKGTAPAPELLAAKDRAENLMITDLVRNDLHQVCDPGTVAVTDLLALEHHPGLVHLVSRVQGRLSATDLSVGGAGWSDLLAATQPPGSVSGAPKAAALEIIGELEPARRGPYCGQIGWIDADAGTACLAVGIRTFWWESGILRFGTGAGITYGSDPQGEWAETELKAARLVGLASS